MKPRWDGDERGHGVADASKVVGELEELRGLASSPNWVAEAPDVHLLPHLAKACQAADSAFRLTSSHIDRSGELVVDLQPRESSAGVGDIRAAVIALVGNIAETATYIRQYRDPLRFEILTGIAPDNGPFATHGHLLTLRITGGA